MRKLLLAALVLAASIALAWLMRRPPPAPPYTTTIPIIRKSASDMDSGKRVTAVPGLYAGRRRAATRR